MSRVALSEVLFSGTNPASFASGRSVTVCERGTETPITLHDAEAAGGVVEQPLATDRVGRILSQSGGDVWVEPGSYDVRVAAERVGEDAQVLHWEAAQGGAGGAAAPAVQTIAVSGAAVTLPTADLVDLTLTALCTITPPEPRYKGDSLLLYLRQGPGGPWGVAWVGVRWSYGASIALTPSAEAIDVATLIAADGVAWDGFPGGFEFK